MKLKRAAAGLLCGVMSISALTACAGNTEKQEETKAQSTFEGGLKTEGEVMHKLVVRAPKNTPDMTATFISTATGKTADVKMEKAEESENIVLFSCEADANMYNLVHLTYGKTTSMDVAFNTFVSGWNLKNDDLLPYVQGSEPVYDPQFETKTFKFDGRDKNVYIWTPKDYDTKADDKYSVIVLFDGQSVLATGVERGMDNDLMCWNVSESVESMMAETDHKAIIVAVDNGSPFRDDELIPDLGSINMEGIGGNAKEEDISLKRGNDFADFVCDTVLPYVQENYNVYTDAEHTSLAGASLGGLETFYTVLAHPDKFGTGGALSSSFGMYADEDWKKFLSDKTDLENAPLLYLYAGGYYTDNGDVTEEMVNRLIDCGYPKDKLVFTKYETGEHFIMFWRNIFPEFLEAAFTQNVTAVPFGVTVSYEDKTDPYEEYAKELELDTDKDTSGYVYYDNSETKWSKVYAYWWGGMSYNSFTKEAYYFAEWPGFEMERIGDSDIYRVAAPLGVTGIIFDSGVTDKQVAAGMDAFQTTDLPYSNSLIGKVYKIDMSVPPKADPGSMKTKRRYSAGNWTDYAEEN